MEGRVKNALIIGTDRRSVDTIEDNLWKAGYRSMLVVEDVAEAWAVVRSLRPSLIVLAPEALAGAPVDELYDISEETGCPIIVATADPAAALRCLGPGVSLDGPHNADAVDGAVAPSRPALHLAEAA